MPTTIGIPTARFLSFLLVPTLGMVMTASAAGRQKAVGAWADVQKLEVGAAVEVVYGESARLRGRLANATEESIVLHVDGADRSLTRSTVRSVAVERRKTARGAAIGLLVGIALAVPNARLQGAGAAAGGTVSCAAIGATIGALSKGYRTVYRATPAGEPIP